MPAYAYAILAVGWLLWVAPFFLNKRKATTPQSLDRRARWGIVLQAIAYFLIWQAHFWMHHPHPWRIVCSILFLLIADLFCWASVFALGRQWRIDAGLNADHQLVRGGAYRIVRHPIYASMLFLLLGTGFMITPLWLLAIAAALMILGIEIRVRIEDRLLASRFGQQFLDYQRTVPAFIPFLKLPQRKSVTTTEVR